MAERSTQAKSDMQQILIRKNCQKFQNYIQRAQEIFQIVTLSYVKCNKFR